MSPLYLYAVLGAAPSGDVGRGLGGERLRMVPCDGVVAAAGEVTTAPSITPDALREHDAVVRRLATRVDALLPARFGSIAAGEPELCARLAASAATLREALARVRGREQMILRVYASAATAPAAAAPADPDAGSPGTRYLMDRARAQQRAAALPELAPIRAVLDRFVVAERVERHEAPPLVASVYHLVARGGAAAYTEAVGEAARTLVGLRVTISGPWAPYAFAPDALA